MAMKALAGAALILGTLALAGTAQAAPGDNGNGQGGCIDNFYGNATNPPPKWQWRAAVAVAWTLCKHGI